MCVCVCVCVCANYNCLCHTGILRHYKTNAVTDDRLYHVTVTHLLRHTAGWDHSLIGDPLMRRDIGLLLNQSGPVGKDDIIRFMMRQPLQFEPGM